MKFHEIFNFSHVLYGLAYNVNGAVVPGLNSSPTIGNQWSTSQGASGRLDDDWFNMETGYTTAQTATTKQLNLSVTLHTIPGFTMTTQSRLFGGMRFRWRPLDRSGRASIQPTRLLNLYQGSNSMGILPVTPAQFESGKEYYAEWEINGKDGRIRSWLDGEVMLDVAMPTWVVTAMGQAGSSYYLNLHHGQLPAIAMQYRENLTIDMRDGYIMEPETDDEARRLGPQKLVKLPISIESSPGWSASDGGTVLNALTHSYAVAADYDAPYAKPDASLGDMDIKLDATNVKGTVNAFMLEMSGRRLTGAPGVIEAQQIKAGSVDATSNFTLAPTTTHGKRLFLSQLQPNGSAWTKTALNALGIRLKPKTV